MTLEVLISTMHQKDMSVADKCKIKSDVLIINQCDEEGFFENSELCRRMISTKERGLSRSRNMAIKNGKTDICLFADDDEILEDNYKTFIVNAFKENLYADLIVFSLHNCSKSFADKPYQIGYKDALKVCSCQVAFRRKKILQNNIWFDEQMGAGTGNGGGEENKFLFDSLRKGLKIYYVPIPIATLSQIESTWFDGYTNVFFLQKGWAVKRIFNNMLLSFLYCVYFSVFKYPIYKKDNNMFTAFYHLLKGIFK